MPEIDIGDYELDQDSNGNLVIKDPNDTEVMKWDESAGQWDFGNQALANLGSINTENGGIKTQSQVHEWVAEHDGSDPDTRLDSALSAVPDGGVVHLGNEKYDEDRTISKSATLVGTVNTNGTAIASGTTWTIDNSHTTIERVDVSGTLALDAFHATLINAGLFGGSVTVSANQHKIIGCTNGDVTFQSGTNSGIIDACTGVTVTDNGSNTVGDIA